MGVLAKATVAGTLMAGALATVLLATDLPGTLGSGNSPVDITCQSITDQPASDGATSNADQIGVSVSDYRGPLLPHESPADWVPQFPVVVYARITDRSTNECDTIDGTEDGPPIVRTTRYGQVLEYVKGEGPEELTLTVLGGSLNGFVTEVDGLVGPDDLVPGSEAVLFLKPEGIRWSVENIYVINGGVARSELDAVEMPTEELLTQLREAAAAETSIE